MLDISRPLDSSARSRALAATWASACLHLVLAILVAAILRDKPGNRPAAAAERHDPPLVVWLDRPGEIGGGGANGNHSARPPQQAQRKGTDRRTVPAPRPRSVEAGTPREAPIQEISIPAVPEASGISDAIGVVSSIAVVDPSSLGPRSGRGSGEGEGNGLDKGQGLNAGGGPPGPGGTLTSPEIIRQVRPNYTNAALQARVRGLVVMDAVVLPDGSVGDVKVVRSLDKRFGLDEEAIKAVKQWRFRPARRSGGPIAMLVSVEMIFELR